MKDERKNLPLNNENNPARTQDPAANSPKENNDFDEIPDLDGDGLIGYTGGNYGDTTYTGGSLIQPQPGIVEEAPEKEDEDEPEDN